MEDSDSDEAVELDIDSDNTEAEPADAAHPQNNNIVPLILHPFLARIRHALFRPDADEEEEEDHDAEEGAELSDEGSADGGSPFDTSLPAQHAYLGPGREVSGRTILEEDLLQTLPLLSMPGFVLVPNQVFPLTLFHPSIISMMKSVLAANKTFGVVNLRANAGDWRGELGTTAEIFEYREDNSQSETATAVGFILKARGRQRFRLKSTRRQIDGNLLGTVEILPEVQLSSILGSYRLNSLNCLASYNFAPTFLMGLSSSNGAAAAAAAAPAWGPPRPPSPPPLLLPQDEAPVRATVAHHRRHLTALAPFPSWVYDMYEAQKLVARVHEELKSWNLGRTGATVPQDPVDLSWWVAASLPIEDSQRSLLLSINCAVQRLRAELSLLRKCRVLICRRCNIQLGDQAEIFSLSSEGPQGAFVNPGGHVHETLTLYRAKNLRLTGTPSTEYSWFPGYAWTIAECGRCFSHIGWKFTATSRQLVPDKFYGFSRRSIEARVQVPQQEEEHEGQDEEEEEVAEANPENRIVM